MNHQTTAQPLGITVVICCFLLLGLSAFTSSKSNAGIHKKSPQNISLVSSKPYLRIEVGMHTAQINGIAVDAKERYLVTASHDKTARVWDLNTGQLLQVLRPPIGDGKEGMLYAVDISPNGVEVAVGGDTGQDASEKHIYIFDRATGRLLRQIGQLPELVDYLIYSPDGSYLVASLGKSGGFRVYDAANLQEVGRDSAYGDWIGWVDFDRSGRLVSSSLDGFVRLYDKHFQLIKKQKLAGGKQPVTARFSPDGTKIAVGFNDSTAVNVIASDTLELLYAPDTHAVDNGNLFYVTWSIDGTELYAGGNYLDSANKSSMMLKWSQAGNGPYTVLPVSTSINCPISFRAQLPKYIYPHTRYPAI